MPTPTDYRSLAESHCWSCAAELPEGVRYCRECGRRVHDTPHAISEATTRRLVVPYDARVSRTQPLRSARYCFKIKHTPLAASILANLLLLALLASPTPTDTMIPGLSVPIIADAIVPDSHTFFPDMEVSDDYLPPGIEVDSSLCAHPVPTVHQQVMTAQVSPSPPLARERRLRLVAHAVERARPANLREHPALNSEPREREVDLRALDSELRSLRRELSRVHSEAEPQISAAIAEAHSAITRQRVRLSRVQEENNARVTPPVAFAKPWLRLSIPAASSRQMKKQPLQCPTGSPVYTSFRAEVKKVIMSDAPATRDGQRDTPAPAPRWTLDQPAHPQDALGNAL